MKQSRIMLAVSASVLAIAGFAATKKYTPVVSGFYQPGSACNVASASKGITLNGGTILTTLKTKPSSGSVTYTVFSQSSGSSCNSRALFEPAE